MMTGKDTRNGDFGAKLPLIAQYNTAKGRKARKVRG